jgi:hypothetical protein
LYQSSPAIKEAIMSRTADALDYTDLYQRWERANWRASELDFSRDREDWHERFSDQERRAALWNYSIFFHGEDSVATNLSSYIDAAPREEQKYFLATQQVDEVRHAFFFARFMHEVVGTDDSLAGALEQTRDQLPWGFRKLFARLDEMAEELRRDQSRAKLAAAVALYHLVIEASLGQPGQHFIERYLTERDVLPGFRAGLRNVALDEQRHIGFGVKLLSDLVAEDPRCRQEVAELLREIQPYEAAVFVPPGWDRRYTECFDFTLEEIYAAAAESFEAKMRAAGLPLDELPGAPAQPLHLRPRERAELGLKLLEAGILGEPGRTPARDPETLAALFETISGVVDRSALPERPFTIQWEFDDADPWFVRFENGSGTASAGRADRPSVRFRCRFDSWCEVVAGRTDPLRSMLRGKLRARGRPGALLRLRPLFGR